MGIKNINKIFFLRGTQSFQHDSIAIVYNLKKINKTYNSSLGKMGYLLACKTGLVAHLTR